MASALTVLLLSCWLAGRSGVSGPWWGQGLGELPHNGEPHSGGPTDGGDGGGYSCQYSTKWDSPVWSEPSDPVQLVVADSFHMWGGGCHWKDARLAWWGQGLGELPRNGEPHSGGPTDGGDGGGYSCQYSTKWDSPVWSEPSDPVQLVVAEGTDPTRSGAMPVSTCPGSTGPGGSEPSAAPDLTRRIMAGVSAAAAGLLLFLLAFLCYRSTRGNTLIGEGKELDVLPQEPDPDYAEVDTQVL
ncbi:unnamed protein product [Lepidochelys kempii]